MMDVSWPWDGALKSDVAVGEDGEARAAFTVSAVGPRGAKGIDLFSFACALWVAWVAVQTVYETAVAEGASVGALVAAVALPVGAYYGLRFGLRQFVRHYVSFDITAKTIRCRRYLWWRKFERSIPHQFLLIDDYRKDRERLGLEHFERKYQGKWWSWSRRRYFGESYHLVLEYQGRRFHIMLIHLHEKAVAVLGRLQAAEQDLDAKTRMGRGVAHDVADAWSRQPGGDLA